MNRRYLTLSAVVFVVCFLIGSSVAQAMPAPVAPVVPNPNCSLVVPAAPLSAGGLATPYQLRATRQADGPCTELDATQAAFVEAAILDPATGTVSVYRPLVVDKGTQPALPPVPVTLPANAVVALWFGSNGDTLKLVGPGSGSAVNGLGNSLFGQFSYIHAPAFFHAAHAAITAGLLTVPPLGLAGDGLPCPTTRDWAVVDQDQSDNVATTYRLVNGQVAQDDTASQALAPGDANKVTNGSDEATLAKRIDPALGCTPWKVPDLTNGGALVPSLATNELSAGATQAPPAALVPLNDPMTLRNGHFSPGKTDLYRRGVDQPPLPAGQTPAQYCQNLPALGLPRLTANQAALAAQPSPTFGTNLYDFLIARYNASLTALGCDNLAQFHQN